MRTITIIAITFLVIYAIGQHMLINDLKDALNKK
jgi:hypothetical protein